MKNPCVIYRYPSTGGKKHFLAEIDSETNEVKWTPFKDEAIEFSYVTACEIINCVLGKNAYIEN